MASDSLSFVAGQVATLTAQFVTSPAGQPVDIPDPAIQIIGPGGETIIGPVSMVHVMTGFYYYDWTIPNSFPSNTYTIRYTGTVLGIPTAASSYVKIWPPGTPALYAQTPKQVELIAALETYLGCAQNIAVYNEIARRNSTKQLFQFSWPRWNLGNHAIFMNDEEVTDGFSIDFDSGTIRFDIPRIDSDRIVGTYNFRFFSQIDLLRFINDAISQYNVAPPGDTWTIDNLPDRLVGVIMQGAAANAIKKMLMCLNFQQIKTIFGGAEEASKTQSNLDSLKKNYEETFNELKKEAKRSRYPSIAAIVQPEYTLPGGRSRWFRYLFSSSVQ